jgi:hypothetical protein
MATEIADIKNMHKRWGALESDRSSWISHYKEISQYILPRSGRFFINDRNKGQKKHNSIYDSTGTRALRVLAAGLMGGATSPARPWFRLATFDRDMMEYGPVKLWLNQCTTSMLDIFQRSNTYRTLHMLYEELGAFGTAASVMMEDFDHVIHHYPLTAGEYCLAMDEKGEVDTLYRKFTKPVSSMVREFGLTNCSARVQNMYARSEYDTQIPILHVVEPRFDRDPKMMDSRNMAWKSCYIEEGVSDRYLREGGMKSFRVLPPRWALTSGDTYGHGPTMEGLGDIKQLQHQQLRKAECIDYMTKPPVILPTGMKNTPINSMPGGKSFYDMNSPSHGTRNLFEVNLNLQHLLGDIQDVRERINSTFYTDLFLMLANDTRSGVTATEVAERHEEKLLMLGPVLERLHNELLDPLVSMTFQRMISAGLVPPPPQELHGQELNVEFVSVLAQAQRAVGVNGIDRYLNTIGSIAQMKPDVLDKVNTDHIADIYADMLGIDPEIVIGGDQVALIRDQRAKAQQQAAQAEQAAQLANTAKTLAQAPTGGEQNALTDATAAFSGYS